MGSQISRIYAIKKVERSITAADDVDITAAKNEETFAKLIQFLDVKSLALVMRDAQDDGRKALKILHAHYAGTGKPRVISLYMELISLVKSLCDEDGIQEGVSVRNRLLSAQPSRAHCLLL